MDLNRSPTDSTKSPFSGFGNSRMADEIRSFNWASTTLGAADSWPLSLRTALRMVLNTEQPICLWLGANLVNFHNDAYTPMLGNRSSGALGKPAEELWPDVWANVLPLVHDALAGKSTRLVDLPLLMTRFGVEEPTFWSFSYSPVFDDDGDIAGMMNIVVESTESVANRESLVRAYGDAQTQLGVQKRLEAEQRTLQAELAHRVKNTIAMTQAIVSQSTRNAGSMDEVNEATRGRLRALADAQDMLVNAPRQRARVRDVLARALQPHEDKPKRFILTGPDAVLSAGQGLGISLAVHELGTNAAKYGSLSHDEGAVEISWEVDEDDRITFEWKEQGGPEVKAPQRTGFGSRLTQNIVAGYFSGTGVLHYEPDGVRFILEGTLEKASDEPSTYLPS